jgi:hypothetical protein
MTGSVQIVGGALPPLLPVKTVQIVCGGRGRGWVYEKINDGTFEVIHDGGRTFVIAESVLAYIQERRETERSQSPKE